jgi:hypothetical protein
MAAGLRFSHISGLKHHKNANNESKYMFFGAGSSISTIFYRFNEILMQLYIGYENNGCIVSNLKPPDMSNFHHICGNTLETLRVKLEYSWIVVNKPIINVKTCETYLQHDTCSLAHLQ